MLYEDVDFETISDRFTKCRMLPFLTHIDGIRASFFFLMNPPQKIPPTMVKKKGGKGALSLMAVGAMGC